eukprot:scaffold29483_cov51-Isochrysis_galbana.AAC.1
MEGAGGRQAGRRGQWNALAGVRWRAGRCCHPCAPRCMWLVVVGRAERRDRRVDVVGRGKDRRRRRGGAEGGFRTR